MVRNYTERPEVYRYGGATVSDITGLVANAVGNTIAVVDASRETGVSQTKHLLSISNIVIDGPVRTFVQINSNGSGGLNNLSLSNAIAEVTEAAVVSTTNLGSLRAFASNVHNTNLSAPVPLGVMFGVNDKVLFVSGHSGFSTIGADSSITTNSWRGPSPDVARVGPLFAGFTVQSDATTTETDSVLLLQPLDDTQSHTSGTFVFYRGASSSSGGARLDVTIQKDASTGDASGTIRFDGHAG
jgi:hypothetical protein